MTNGTSQGLFIVVAIVIFGIFVGLSYTVFGKEGGLTESLQGLFYSATEQVIYDTPKTESVNLLSYSDVKPYNMLEGETYINNGESIILETVRFGAGLRLPYQLMQSNKEYKLTFKTQKISGTVSTIGGHLWHSEDTRVFIDGNLVTRFKPIGVDPKSTNNWSVGVPYPQDSEEHLIEVFFDTNNYDLYTDKETVLDYAGAINADFYIQPNRTADTKLYKLEITDLGLYAM